MGWAKGSYVMEEVINGLLSESFTEEERVRIYKVLIPAMQNCDWDTEYECLEQDEAYDQAMRELGMLDDDEEDEEYDGDYDLDDEDEWDD